MPNHAYEVTDAQDEYNPWHDLSRQPPFVLQQDAEAVKRFNRGKPVLERFRLNLVPEPFWGNLVGTQVLLLNEHPAPYQRRVKEPDLALFEKNLREACFDIVYLPRSAYLQTEYDKAASIKWKLLLKPIIDVCGMQEVIEHVGCLNWYPYRIEYIGVPEFILPSQGFTTKIILDFIKFQRMVVMLHDEEKWFQRVPQLRGYELCFRFDEKCPQQIIERLNSIKSKEARMI